MTPKPVECVEGCGGESVLAVASIVIAAVSVIATLASLYTNRRMFKMARTEHAAFLAQLNARADFKPTVEVPHHEIVDGVLETEADRIGITLQIGIANTGDKSAPNVGVNLLLPAKVRDVEWIADKNRGLPLPTQDRAAGPLDTPEELIAKDGSRHRAYYLTRIYDTIGTSTHVVGFAKLGVAMPGGPGTHEIVVPVKLKVWNDDVPQGRIEQIEFTLRRTVG